MNELRKQVGILRWMEQAFVKETEDMIYKIIKQKEKINKLKASTNLSCANEVKE